MTPGRRDDRRDVTHGRSDQRRPVIVPWVLLGLFVLTAGLAVWLDAQAYATHAPRQVGPTTWVAERLLSMGALVPALAFAFAGAAIASRRRANTIGWVMLVAGLLFGAAALATSYASVAIAGSPSDPPVLGVVAKVAEFPAFTLGLVLGLVFVPLLFPVGHLPSGRWRPVAWVAGLLVVLDAVRSVFTPRLADSLQFFDQDAVPIYDVANPLAVDWMQPVTSAVSMLGIWLALFSVVAATGAVIVRFRRSEGAERQQMKWFVYAAALVALVFASLVVRDVLVGDLGQALDPLSLFVLVVGLSAYPVAVGVAVLRYRLYEIDRLISRTVSYGLVVAVLGAVYVGVVAGLGTAATAITGDEGGDLVVAVATLTVAGLFGPVRSRVQSAVDRRFNRTGFEARRPVEAFNHEVRDEVDLASIRERTAETAAVAVQPSHVSVWLTDREEQRA